jgi:ribose-phosphate pyrophosphokinase
MTTDQAVAQPHSIDPNGVRFFSGRSHPTLANGIAAYLGVPLDPTHISRFSNDNLYVQLGATVRGRAVFIVQSLISPVSDHLLELLMMLDIARSAGARQVHAVIPYFSYARSDKKDAPRISITARLIADLLATAGATHVMTMQLHSPQVHGFFSMPTDPLTARALFVHHFSERHFDPNDTVVVAPDVGHAKSAGRFASNLGLPAAAGDKTRLSDTEVAIGGLVGKQVKGFRRALIYDDEIATGGSVVQLSQLLIETGIEEIIVICTHGLFVNRAMARLAAIPQITEIVTTDTVPQPIEGRPPTMTVLSVAPLFGEAIHRNCTRQSIGDLFTFGDDAAVTR